jgi:hypothetical protein
MFRDCQLEYNQIEYHPRRAAFSKFEIVTLISHLCTIIVFLPVVQFLCGLDVAGGGPYTSEFV